MMRRVLVPAAAVAAASLTIAVWLKSRTPAFTPQPELAELVEAVGTDRRIEPRLTGGFAYGPFKGVVRSGDSEVSRSSADVRLAVTKLERLTERSREKYLSALGVAFLAVSAGDKAVKALEEAADTPATDARTLSNLAAAYLVRSPQQDQPEDLARALSAAQRAAMAAPGLAEPSFNRALGLERLHLTNQARRAWDEYLQLDGASEWAAEARWHIQALARAANSEDVEPQLIEQAAHARDDDLLGKLVRQSPHAAGQWLQQQLLVSWPSSYLADDELRAAEILHGARRAADILARAFGDRFYQAAVQAIDRHSSPTRRAALARAHQTFARGITEYEQDALPESTKLFAEARATLIQAGSPFALWTDLQAAIALYSKSDMEGAARRLDPLLPAAYQAGYVRLLGAMYRLRGLIQGARGDFPNQVTRYRAALQQYERIRDFESVARMHASLAESLELQGELRDSWMHRSRALAELRHVRKVPYRQAILVGLVDACLRQGLPHAALVFQDAVLDDALRWNRPRAVAEAYLKRAEVRQQLGLAALAADDLTEAERRLQPFASDERLLSRMRASIELAKGELYQRTEPERAIRELTAALEYYHSTGVEFQSMRAYLALGRAHIAAGRSDLAEADFAAGIGSFEQQRRQIDDESLRIASFDKPWDPFTEMIRLKAVGDHQPDIGLRFAEQARSRTLLETVSGSRTAAPVDPALVRDRLPLGVALIYYVVTDQSVLGWVLRRDAVTFFQPPLRESELTRLVAASHPSTAPPAKQTDTLSRLYDELIRPVRSALTGIRTVVIMPDGVMNTLPFAALIDRDSGRYLVEDYAIAITPSMTVFLDLATRAGSRAPESALAIGNPARPDGSALPQLPDAEEEARDVAHVYPRSELLIGADATKERFLRQLDRHDVVHFAGHAIADLRVPGRSRLLFASAGENAPTSDLFAGELRERHLRRLQVLILAACRTGAGQIRRGEGVLNLVRPFLAAGVPVVIASQSDLDDRESRRLFDAFHRALRAGLAPFEALRRAQLAAINEEHPNDPTRAWATVVAIGGVAGLGAALPAVGTPEAGFHR